jgi:hypothetical protein
MEAQVSDYLKTGASSEDRKAAVTAICKALTEKRAGILDVVRTAASDLTWIKSRLVMREPFLLSCRSRRFRAGWSAMTQTCGSMAQLCWQRWV